MAKYFVVVNNKEDCPEYFIENTCRIYTEIQFIEASKNQWKINIHSKIDVFDNLSDAQERKAKKYICTLQESEK